MADPIRPMLGDLTLQQAQLIGPEQRQTVAEHDVPGLEGDFLQRLGRQGGAVEVVGIQSGPEAREGLNDLRDLFRAGDPVTFASDITSATTISDTLIEDLEIVERAGKPDCYAYRFRLREFTPAPDPEPERPPPPPPPVRQEAALIVTVKKEGDPNFDASDVIVQVTGQETDGAPLDRTLSNRVDNRWTEDPFPAGSYTASARAPGAAADGSDLTGSTPAEVAEGATAEVCIILRDGAAIAYRFLIHFRFDSAFIEPCLKPVLRQVTDFARDNADMKLLTVGHTDLAGSVDYNQSLSERRARSAFAMLRFGNDSATSIAEWDALRRLRTPGTLPSERDSWGTREYQQILQDRDVYNGAIDGDHGPRTDAAVREFQTDNGLTPDGVVGDGTWLALIEAYLSAENLSIPDDRFLPNCPGEFLRWVGCSELDPVKDTQDAWRPNRRTEFLFVRADALPADVPPPVTMDLPTPGAGAPGWCLNDSGTTKRCCFTKRYDGVADKEQCAAIQPRGAPWTRVEAEPSPSFTPQIRILFEDGTPYVGQYVLTAPDGEYMDGEVERSSGGLRAGTPRPGQTEADGTKSYPKKQKRPGIFILEVLDDVVARPAGTPISAAKGPIVCMRLASDTDLFDVVIVSRAIADITPRIEFPGLERVGAGPITPPKVVLVKKAHTNPRRQQVVLRVEEEFEGSGTLRLASGEDKLKLFDAPAGGNQMTFDGVDNVFTPEELNAGVTRFAEGGPAPSDAVDDVALELALTVGGSPGATTTETTTALELTLDIARDRGPVPGIDPTPLSEAEKIAPGRLLQIQTPENEALRAMLIVRRAVPEAFDGELEITASSTDIQLFALADEVPAAGQTPITLPHPIANQTIPSNALPLPPGPGERGAKFWVEARSLPAGGNLTLQLGVKDVEPDGDRVTVVPFDLAIAANATPTSGRVSPVRIEGILNSARAAFDLGDLFDDQPTRLFRVRAQIPGATAPVTAQLRSEAADGSLIEQIDVTLADQGGGVFVNALPILAVPAAIARNQITFAAPQDIEILRSRAEGTMRVSLTAPAGATGGRTSARVEGRVCLLNVGILDSSAANDALVDTDLARTNEVWSQCGVEFRLLGGATTALIDPGGLDVIEALPANFFNNLGTERRTLFALNPSTDNIDIYYVGQIIGVFGEGFAPNDLFAPMAAFRGDLVIDDSITNPNTVLAHELGHILINLPTSVNAGGDEHNLFTFTPPNTFTSGAAVPTSNVMTADPNFLNSSDMTQDQCRRALLSTFLDIL
ncbi:MAG: peptidoglycan-binding protein [Pseudomonadota bacterium]